VPGVPVEVQHPGVQVVLGLGLDLGDLFQLVALRRITVGDRVDHGPVVGDGLVGDLYPRLLLLAITLTHNCRSVRLRARSCQICAIAGLSYLLCIFSSYIGGSFGSVGTGTSPGEVWERIVDRRGLGRIVVGAVSGCKVARNWAGWDASSAVLG
jgi:hypothetical protein